MRDPAEIIRREPETLAELMAEAIAFYPSSPLHGAHLRGLFLARDWLAFGQAMESEVLRLAADEASDRLERSAA